MNIGVDMVEIDRLVNLSKNPKLLQKVYTEKELSLLENQSQTRCHEILAGRFAAKEATLKALGTGILNGISLKHVETIQGIKGEPVLILKDQALKVAQEMGLKDYSISLSHTDNLAIAFVVLK